MAGADLTVKILREIRDEIRNTNQRLDQTNQRLDKVDGTLLDLAEQQRFVVRYVKALSERDSRMDVDVADLRARVEVLEKKVGGKRR
jgi:septal ring factor EnvC (AmiA/AmiB activator)